MPKIHLIIPDLSEQDIQRLWSKIDVREPDECWMWLGVPRGRLCPYGAFSIKHRSYLANRVVYKVHYGEDLGALKALHRCDIPLCCNPHHLFKGTQLDNRRDCKQKGRTATGKRQGAHTHPERHPRGETSGRSVLTEIQVREIRQLAATGLRATEVYRRTKYVSYRATYSVIVRKTWQHVE